MQADGSILTILTPTFNRKDRLARLKRSLDTQTIKGFQWLVIDDGSSDRTGAYFREIRTDGYSVEYHYKANGGKHTAINYALPYIKGEYVCIVDSDDALLPDAVAEMLDTIERYGDDRTIACFSFQRGKNADEPLVKRMPDVPVVSNHIDYRLNGRRFGDCCEVVRTEALKAYPFPEYPGEKFISEGYLWVQLGKRYKTVYNNRIVYLCEYLEDGLTKAGRKARMRSPLGGMTVCNTFLSVKRNPRLHILLAIKKTWLYICYAKYAGYSFRQMKEKCERPELMTVNYPMGLLMYRIFRRKNG